MPTTELVIPGETAVITGAGSGIGLRIADHLADCGVDVAINDVDEDALAEARERLHDRDGAVRTVRGDVTDPDTTDELVDTAVDAFGGVDILVNNVGIAGPTRPCEEITSEEFVETLEVNLGGMHATTRAAIPHLEGDGRIVNVASISGKRPLSDRTPYTTSKMGVIGYTRTLAIELADRGVTVNAVCPGSVEGARLREVIEAQAERQDRSYDDMADEFRSNAPMNEFVDPDDVADAVLVLCSTRADRMTGQDVNVSAGKVMY